LSEYLQDIFNSQTKQVNIVSALIIANTIFERYITRFTHLVSEVLEKSLKKFYGSMKSKFLRERMSNSTKNIFKILIAIKLESLKTFNDCKLSLFMNEANLKRIDLKDFEPYENIIAVFNTNLRVLFDNNLIVVNEMKLDKSLADSYIADINAMQSYEYCLDYNRLKLLQDYYRALSNKVHTDINHAFSHERWAPAEVDYGVSEVLSFILNAKYLKAKTDFILNETVANPAEGKGEESGTPILIYKREIHVNNIKFILSRCYCMVLDAVRDFLQLGSTFLSEEPDVVVVMVQRIIDVIIVAVVHAAQQLSDHAVHLVGGSSRLQPHRKGLLRPPV